MKNKMHDKKISGFERFLETFVPDDEVVERISRPYVDLCRREPKI